jgi:hypothetical protein
MKLEANKELHPHHLPSIGLDGWVLIHYGQNLRPDSSYQQAGSWPLNGLKICYLKISEHLRTIIKSFFPIILGASKNQCLKIWMKT